MQKKNIIFNMQVNESSNDIFADRNYLYRVIYNFIDNAIKFSNENGVIELRTEEKDNSVRISVIDNGIGIDKNYIEDIWERYYKNKESGGMGIGLAICSEILKLHDFEYGVISEKGKMTEFYFIVPKIKKNL